jgi:hypothetical protein
MVKIKDLIQSHRITNFELIVSYNFGRKFELILVNLSQDNCMRGIYLKTRQKLKYSRWVSESGKSGEK